MFTKAGTEVAGTGKRKPGPGCGAVDCGDHRFLQPSDRLDVRVVVAAEAGPDFARVLSELRQVLADAEAAAGARDHHRADVVGASLFQGRSELLQRGGLEGIEDLRAVKRDRENRPVASCLHFGHAREPKGRAAARHAVASLAGCRN
jgi:hypothetical protein